MCGGHLAKIVSPLTVPVTLESVHYSLVSGRKSGDPIRDRVPDLFGGEYLRSF